MRSCQMHFLCLMKIKFNLFRSSEVLPWIYFQQEHSIKQHKTIARNSYLHESAWSFLTERTRTKNRKNVQSLNSPEWFGFLILNLSMIPWQHIDCGKSQNRSKKVDNKECTYLNMFNSWYIQELRVLYVSRTFLDQKSHQWHWSQEKQNYYPILLKVKSNSFQFEHVS